MGEETGSQLVSCSLPNTKNPCIIMQSSCLQFLGNSFCAYKKNIMNLLLGLSNIFVGIVIIAISIPLVLEKVPMNPVYGVRFKKSYESKENWYKINKYGGKQLILWSIPLLIIGVVTLFFPSFPNKAIENIILCAPLIVLVPAYMSYRYSKKI